MNEQMALKLCLKHKDPRGFEFLVEQFRREAYYHAFSLLGNGEDAADACQESFTRAFMALPRMSGLDRFYPWFYRILRNCCLNMLSRRKTVVNYQHTERKSGSTAVEKADPMSLLEQKEKQQQIWNVLQALNVEHREILLLKYKHGWKYDEIATLLDIPRGTVMSRLYKARTVFRELYNQQKISGKSPVKEVTS